MSWITAPFAWQLKALYELTGSYGWAVILFGVVVNLILLPFMAKSKKSMMRTSRLQPRIAELQRRHEGNQQKLNEEMAKLYREEKINPMSGCLWSLLPFPILLALYRAVVKPLTIMMGIDAAAIAAGGAIVHENPVVVDEFIITSRGAGTALELGLEIVRYLLGDEAVDEVARGVVLAR